MLKKLVYLMKTYDKHAIKWSLKRQTRENYAYLLLEIFLKIFIHFKLKNKFSCI